MERLIEQVTCAASLGRGLRSFCEIRNLDLDAACELLNIDPVTFSEYRARISMDKFTRLLELLSTAANDPCFGLNYANAFTLGDTGPLGFALQNAPSFRDVWLLVERFSNLSADNIYYKINFQSKSVFIEWAYSPLLTNMDQFADFGLAIKFRILRLYGNPNWMPEKVSLNRALPKDTKQHHKVFGSNVKFEMLSNKCEFSTEGLNSVKPDADNRLYQIMVERCEEFLLHLSQSSDVIKRLKHVIIGLAQLNGVSLVRAAASVGMSERTLQRRLLDLNYTFELVVEEARRELFETLIHRVNVPIAEISWRCGYSSPTAFSRAVKQWHGRTPSELREQASV